MTKNDIKPTSQTKSQTVKYLLVRESELNDEFYNTHKNLKAENIGYMDAGAGFELLDDTLGVIINNKLYTQRDCEVTDVLEEHYDNGDTDNAGKWIYIVRA